jgi:hypothetical protein
VRRERSGMGVGVGKLEEIGGTCGQPNRSKTLSY